MRGKPPTLCLLSFPKRITPACAGKTLFCAVKKPTEEDHPRVCGENAVNTHDLSVCIGSPPRVRGKHLRVIGCCEPTGITPACAGKTYIVAGTDVRAEDHPRVCGENAISPRHAHRRAGSPPRVRGKQVKIRPLRAEERITPACAGKTAREVRRKSAKKDHPRVCGENSSSASSPFIMSGSPPRVRGKLRHERRVLVRRRITPACAGKTTATHPPSREK